MSSFDAAATTSGITSCIEQLAAPDALNAVTPEDLQRLLGAAVRLYAQKVEEFGGFPMVPQDSITATDAMIGASGLLRAANVAVFELGCWQQWTA